MKISFKILLPCILLLCIFLLGSSIPPPQRGGYSPIFMERSELEKSVSYIAQSKELVKPGKIYYKDSYIYVNEKYKGVHVINNTNPRIPINEGFILAPGCIDMAVKGNVLYLDNSVDLVAFDLETKKVTQRIKNVFPEPAPPAGEYYFNGSRPNGFVIVDWKKKK